MISTGKISNSVLWICMIASFLIFGCCFIGGTDYVGALLYFLYILLLLTVVVSCLFTFVHFIKIWKKNPGKAWRRLVYIMFFAGLLAATYMLGDESFVYPKEPAIPVNLLKITDMWLYSIFVLLGLVSFALVIGIGWSYWKKIKWHEDKAGNTGD